MAFYSFSKSRKPVAPQSEIGNLAGLELEGQFVSDKGDEFRSKESATAVDYGVLLENAMEKPTIYYHIHGINAHVVIKLEIL